jgi:hypothetical protein
VSGTFEIVYCSLSQHLLFSLATLNFHIRYILHLRATLFYFILADTPSTYLVWIFVGVLQMAKIPLANYVSLHVMCVLFLSSINRKINTSTFYHRKENPQFGIPYVYVSDCSDQKKNSTKPYGCFMGSYVNEPKILPYKFLFCFGNTFL